MRIEIEREEDGRWIADVPDLPGATVYGGTRADAIARVEALALRVIADRLKDGEAAPELGDLFDLPTATRQRRRRPEVTLRELPKILAKGPRLSPEEADSFLKDIDEARESLPAKGPTDPWES